MKTKLFIVFISVIVFSLVTFSQVHLVSATHGRTSSPITFASHVLSGSVIYKILRIGSSDIEPANNVAIEARNRTTDQLFTTHTDENGHYSLTLPMGMYEVSASDTAITRMIPSRRPVYLNRDRTDIDFNGLLRP